MSKPYTENKKVTEVTFRGATIYGALEEFNTWLEGNDKKVLHADLEFVAEHNWIFRVVVSTHENTK